MPVRSKRDRPRVNDVAELIPDIDGNHNCIGRTRIRNCNTGRELRVVIYQGKMIVKLVDDGNCRLLIRNTGHTLPKNGEPADGVSRILLKHVCPPLGEIGICSRGLYVNTASSRQGDCEIYYVSYAYD